MAARLPTLEKPPTPPRSPDGFSGDRGPGRGGDDAATPATPARVFAWLFVGTVIVLFAAFTTTYLARRGEPGWSEVPLPPVLWLSTLILAVSSAVLEWARRQGRAGRVEGLRRGLLITTVLGAGFLVSQLVAWRQLVSAGLYLSANPHSSFFYLLTGAHGLHLVGGLGALVYTGWKVRQIDQSAPAVVFTDPAATYWHFLGILWVYLFALLFWL